MKDSAMTCNKRKFSVLLTFAVAVALLAPKTECKINPRQKSSSFKVRSRSRLSYSTLEGLGVACSPLDTCSLPRTNDDLLHYNCECGEHCTRFKTCCVDSPFLKGRSLKKIRASCVQLANHPDPVFMIARCKKRWRGDNLVRLMCEENKQNLSDPFRLRPVTSPSKQVTYKNGFCALCNKEKGDLIPWSVAGETDIPLVKADMENLVYDRETDTWKVRDQIGPAKSVFVPLRIKFSVPDHLSSLVVHCQPGLVSSCDPTWKGTRTKKRCHSYMASVSSAGLGSPLFRNAHCAMCNHVANLTRLSCLVPFTLKSLSRPISFAILLDVNKSDGDVVGRTNICKQKEIYDPFFKKCRPLACALPGYVVRGNKCVPE